jgi:oligopeptide/dipeptide ABC transporter ATP-binding protein
MAAVLAVHDLAVEFPSRAGPVRPVDGISFELGEGETLALVGESGSGKTLTALALLGLVPRPGRVAAGRAFFQERNLLRLPERELRALRGRSLAIVFQDPLSSLHPLLTVGRQLTETIEAHERVARRATRVRAAAALGEVGLPHPEELLDRYPHELSGGQRQRVLIAMALLLHPQVLFADEPTTALDVTLQAQVLELLADLRRARGTAVVLITHDLGVVAGTADRVHVLYAGRTVETGGARELLARPLHPYTRGLLASVPSLEGEIPARLTAIPGHPPDPAARPPGCAFHPRCDLAQDACRARVPELAEVRRSPERRSACLELERLLGEEARR